MPTPLEEVFGDESIEFIERAAIRAILVSCQGIRKTHQNPFAQGTDLHNGHYLGWSAAFEEIEANIRLTLGD